MAVYIPVRHLGKAFIESQAKTPTKQQRDISKAYQKLHARVQRNLIGLPPYQTEVLFHPTRKWRMDYAWPDLKIALEVHGVLIQMGVTLAALALQTTERR